MRKIFTYSLCLLALFCGTRSFAQHFQFSQFYAAPTYLNPAFTGANACGRFSVNYRSQWSGVPGEFVTYQATFDHYLPSKKSGIGLQVLKDVAGLGSLSTTMIYGLYAYELRINKRVTARVGFNAGSVQRSVDLSKLTFGDQIEEGASASRESHAIANTSYFDMGTGGLIFTRQLWAGFSFNHITKPNQSLMNGISPLPGEFKMHGGYNIQFDEAETRNKNIPPNNYLTIAANYKKQRKYNQIDLGVYYSKNLLVIGLWYRGIPIWKPVPEYRNNDAIIGLFGINVGKYKIGYSYDYTLSKLTNAASKGAHELSMALQLCSVKKARRSKRRTVIVCPKF